MVFQFIQSVDICIALHRLVQLKAIQCIQLLAPQVRPSAVPFSF